MMDKKWEQLELEINICRRCELYRNRMNSVIGEGNINADVMIIADYPGVYEDRIGKPFQGKNGELFNKIMTSCGFSRNEHIYIAYVLKCKPFKNEKPNKQILDSCSGFLYKQIDLIKPKIIVLMGATALSCLYGNEIKLSNARGTWLKWDKTLIMATHHPSALIKNPKLKNESWSDCKQIISKYREIVDYSHFAPFF